MWDSLGLMALWRIHARWISVLAKKNGAEPIKGTPALQFQERAF
jgi:hypothetical protein